MSPHPTLDLYAPAGPWRFIDHLGPQWAEPPPEFRVNNEDDLTVVIRGISFSFSIAKHQTCPATVPKFTELEVRGRCVCPTNRLIHKL